MISYFNPLQKYFQNTNQNIKIHTKRMFTMKDILINLVRLNMGMRMTIIWKIMILKTSLSVENKARFNSSAFASHADLELELVNLVGIEIYIQVQTIAIFENF